MVATISSEKTGGKIFFGSQGDSIFHNFFFKKIAVFKQKITFSSSLSTGWGPLVGQTLIQCKSGVVLIFCSIQNFEKQKFFCEKTTENDP